MKLKLIYVALGIWLFVQRILYWNLQTERARRETENEGPIGDSQVTSERQIEFEKRTLQMKQTSERDELASL